MRKRYRDDFSTLGGWRFEADLFLRLMRYGGPAGMQIFLDVLVFNLFVQIVGRLGEAALGATTLTIRLNMVAFLPMMGLGQAVCILVGQRLGADRPALAERTTYTGLKWMFGYMCLVAAVYLLLPHSLVALFEDEANAEKLAGIAAIVPTLLICVAIYSVADSINVTFAFALRGAGDTTFVTACTFLLAWPIMVIPTYLVVTNGGSVYWAWAFATAHILAMSVCFGLRFRHGKWKTMRVIEPAVV
jgi:MATE family multidrug resistance protein